MYATHQPLIAAHARRGPSQLRDVLAFAAATAHLHFAQVPALMAEYHTGELGSFQPNARDTASADHRFLFDWATDVWAAPASFTDTALLSELARVRGLGPAKAGFAAQLLFGRVGCLDTHNLRAYGVTVPPRFDRCGATTRVARLADYCATCAQLGSSAFLWDSWCASMADRYPWDWGRAELVSAAHVNCILGEAA